LYSVKAVVAAVVGTGCCCRSGMKRSEVRRVQASTFLSPAGLNLILLFPATHLYYDTRLELKFSVTRMQSYSLTYTRLELKFSITRMQSYSLTYTRLEIKFSVNAYAVVFSIPT
jgi:hypothetical protein